MARKLTEDTAEVLIEHVDFKKFATACEAEYIARVGTGYELDILNMSGDFNKEAGAFTFKAGMTFTRKAETSLT